MSEEPQTLGRRNSYRRPLVPCATGEGVPLEAWPVTGRFPARKVPQPRSTPSREKSQAVPEENASRVLPRALRKTSPASADDMARDFLPCLGTSCGRRERVHTTLRPAGTVCGTCPPLPDGQAGRGRAGAACEAWEGQGVPLGSTRVPARSESSLHRSRSGVEALRLRDLELPYFNKYRVSL